MEALKMKSILCFISVLTGSLLLNSTFGSTLHAAEGPSSGNLAQKLQSVSAREVRKLMRQAQKECPRLDCKDSRLQVQPLTDAEIKNLGAPLRGELRKIARGLA